MGGCAGKNKSKSYKLKSNLTENSEAKTKGFIYRICFFFHLFCMSF